jgi:hypothetical protein
MERERSMSSTSSSDSWSLIEEAADEIGNLVSLTYCPKNAYIQIKNGLD